MFRRPDISGIAPLITGMIYRQQSEKYFANRRFFLDFE